MQRALLLGEFAPGERITEERVCEMLGVSRTPVREALNLLGQEGVVDIREGGGFISPSLSLKQLEDIFEVQELLEPYAARKGVKYCTGEDIAEMRELIDKEVRLLENPDVRSFQQSSRAFRSKLFSLCANERLIKTINSLVGSFQASFGVVTLRSVELRKVLVNGHKTVVASFVRKDESAVEAAWKIHLEKAHRVTLTELERSGSGNSAG
jgi:DNA-binding GntR family transcriptional regulator